MRPARTALWLRLALALGLALVGPLPVGWSSARAPIYVSSWAVRVSQGYREAERLARKFGFVYLGQIFPDGQYFHLRHRGVVQQSLTPHWGHCLRLKKDPKVQWFEQQTLRRRVKRSVVVPTDPWFPKQWYMNNKVQPDLNILQVWSQGLSGQGVVVSVLDDGIEKDHPDLWANYDPLASYDFNDYDPDPQPRYTPSDENRHGTRCAGEVAAMANNGFCGTGVAYNARIGGVRMLDGTITDVIEAQSLSLQPQHIHIYSASWGPEDDGRTVDGPGILTREAFRRGVTKGRGGLGTLFVWASGNGGLHYDNCNCDGYTNSIHTLSVGSTTQNGRVPWYSEACASTLTTTYSSGVATDPQIVTTDLHHQCTDKHTGTSASAPLAAGMIALALEANPFLTWRDMQHLVVRASRPAQLQAEDWRTNGVGRQVSHHYGYGLLDARLLVDMARTWLPTQPQQKCVVRIVHTPTPAGGALTPHAAPSPILPLTQVRKNVSACAGRANYIRSLEHVQVQLSLSYSRRGDLEISLTSPMGTRSTLVAIRPLDVSGQGYNNWIFMSTHFWDEDPRGLWTLGLENKGYYFNTGTLYRYTLLLYGTAEDMTARPPGPQVTSSACVQRDTEGLCQECHSSAYTLGHLCLSYCPPRYCKHTQQAVTGGPGRPATPALHVCSSCRASCCPCRGGSPLNCTACPPSYSLREHRGSCSGPVPPNSPPQPTAVGHPRCHRGRAQAVVLTLLAVAFGSPLLCRILYRLPAARWGPPRRWGHPRHPPRSSCCLEPRDI
ncbi:proprotein convertase subtilisin/kexin type 4 isoform X2 [Canis lupus familiaris]|uniref:proprotein convertase subtilisin/kexin type 4 isoform X2 n=1 Tax=Canis lupus familiaris TaxID=9615 RepID=UPI000DC6AA10|nr:proprotein convertase subtilisin/kexin type 4 isoform X2 [Canis lupus familiaris]XP_025312504.1 proprotein convertase subtilisin/kexin type 4 isoform X2 [Canis lupus dingo]XP_038285226.1 proprotein convertase subtilisin/kexin type 4 isoform X2 [Canis lupus familiaris]XP_038423908.1 proprotein convertase subtilisin/kexin type 4 isoform X2 [Canis lupus familiaris]